MEGARRQKSRRMQMAKPYHGWLEKAASYEPTAGFQIEQEHDGGGENSRRGTATVGLRHPRRLPSR
jgi:hypothetical protein